MVDYFQPRGNNIEANVQNRSGKGMRQVYSRKNNVEIGDST